MISKCPSISERGEFYASKDLCWIHFPDARRNGVQGSRPVPAHPDADQNAQTDLHTYQRGYSDGGGHGDGDTIADGHTYANGHARARRYGHTFAHGYAGPHRHACAYPATATDQHARTNGPTSTPPNPDA
jgi:hypothetical protein